MGWIPPWERPWGALDFFSITWRYENMLLQLGKGFPLEPNYADALILKLQPEISDYCYRVYDTLSQRSERTRPCDDNIPSRKKKKTLWEGTQISEHSPHIAVKWTLKALHRFRCMGDLVWAGQNDSSLRNRVRKSRDQNRKGKSWEISPQGGGQSDSHRRCCLVVTYPYTQWWEAHLTCVVFPSDSCNLILS